MTTVATTATPKERPKPFLLPEFCKGCGRCISACPKHCITFEEGVHPVSGLRPVHIDLDACNACGLCITACPEPYGLQPETPEASFELEAPQHLFGDRHTLAPEPVDIPDRVVALPAVEPLIIKGTYASAIGALLAGCRHFFGYPITPSTEGAELMAKLLPKLGGAFHQAVSEVATVNHMYGTGGAGMRVMTYTSSPGFSLMLEGVSYMVGAEVPGLFVNVMRGGPGLGNIAPEQSDIKLACHGLGHGNTQAIVLAPGSPQEMLDLTMLGFELAMRYRNPVVLLADGYLGQMTGKVRLPETMVVPGLPAWAVHGDRDHRRNLICSILLDERDLERHNEHLLAKYQAMTDHEQRADLYAMDDATTVVVACNTPARMAKGAVEVLRRDGMKVGLFRPITLWPFPIAKLRPFLGQIERFVVVEASDGQLEDELRLALSYAGVTRLPRVDRIRHYGGVLPQVDEVAQRILDVPEVAP